MQEPVNGVDSEIQLVLLDQKLHSESFYLLTQEEDFKNEFAQADDSKENIVNSIIYLSAGKHQKFYAITRDNLQVGVLSIKKKENHFPEGYFEENELDFLDVELSQIHNERRLQDSPFYIDIYISKDFRQQQLGTLALRKIMFLLKEEEHKEIFFNIRIDNENSIKLVERLGAILFDENTYLKRYKLDI